MGWFGSSSKSSKTKDNASSDGKSSPNSKKDGTLNKKSVSSRNNNNSPLVTIERLRATIDQQEKREQHIQSKMDTLAKLAKLKFEKGDKKGALFAMKQRKMLEGELDKISNVKMTLETQTMNLESAVQNKDTFQTLKQGTSAMQKIRKDMNIDKVDDMMDDIREEMETHQEISMALGQTVDLGLPMDDDELLNELSMLQEADAKQEASRFPSVPTGRLSTTTTTKKQQQQAQEEASMLSELRAMMA